MNLVRKVQASEKTKSRLRVSLSFTLLFSFHFYLYSVLNLFFNVDST